MTAARRAARGRPSSLLSRCLLSCLLFGSAVYGMAIGVDHIVLQPPSQPHVSISDHDETASDTLSQKPYAPTRMGVIRALEVMQNAYFEVFTGTWPSAIDWTAAVLGTHISASLSTLVTTTAAPALSCKDRLAWSNLIDKYFAQTSVFYFGENAFGIRNQAYDDMLWVVLGWLENAKFMETYSIRHWETGNGTQTEDLWHGMQFSQLAAHRARIFYELASEGWDTGLCGGGMTWNPRLKPYKNAITNELFIAASISMYLYFPGDENESPYVAMDATGSELLKPHDPKHLQNAISGYRWLRESHMRNDDGLFMDGFHITGWLRFPDGSIHPGTRKCDELNSMVYTYNQGVLLTAHRGLWMATGERQYLDDGHNLVDSVIKATGWPTQDMAWHGLGRGGILEDYCDQAGRCSQDSQTFKGIFFHHMAEFCRPLWAQEEQFLTSGGAAASGFDQDVWEEHLERCRGYATWITHNAEAAKVTMDADGIFGMWWGRTYPDLVDNADNGRVTPLPAGAVDYQNEGIDESQYGRWLLTSAGHSAGEANEREQRLRQSRPRRVQRTSDDYQEVNDRGRGRTVETQSGGLAVLRAHLQWQSILKATAA